MQKFPAMTAMTMLALVFMAANAGTAADAPKGCAQLCGNWMLDAAGGESPEQLVDAAMERYRVPRQNGPRFARSGEVPASGSQTPDAGPPDAGDATDARDDADNRPAMHSPRETMRDELVAALRPPAGLTFSDKGKEILLRAAGGPERRMFPGEPHSRVDSRGTARIRSDWKKGALTTIEDFGRGRTNTETYAPQPDGTLQLSLVLERPGIKPLRLRAVYRRGEAGR